MNRGEHGGAILRLIVLVILLALVFLVYLVRHPILRAMGEFWVVGDALQPADALVVIGGDNAQAQRAARAAELFHARWAPRVVASGPQWRSYFSQADLTQRDLQERGVPAEAIVRLSHSTENTLQEAQTLRRLAVEQGWERLLVVTSNYHTRRTRYIYRRVFPASIQIRVAAAPDSQFDPDRWWRSRQGVKLFFYELVGSVVAMWELRGATESVPPGAAFSIPLRRAAGGWVF